MRILIAEDDRVFADGLLRSLRNAGYAVDGADDGSQADAALTTHEFDLMILDLGADDHMAKPFSLQEFEARVRAPIRRGLGSASAVSATVR